MNSTEFKSANWAYSLDQLNWLPDTKAIFDCASRRFAENKGMSHALILIDISGIAVPADEDMPVGTSSAEYTGEAMSAIAKLIISACGKYDIVGAVGADRFAVVTSGFANRVELEKLISKIIYRIRVADLPGDIHPNAEVGAAVLDGSRMSAAELFKAAELALFKVKDKSEDSYEIFDRKLSVADRSKSRASSSTEASRIQQVFDYSFEALSNEDEQNMAIKDVLSFIGASYKLDRIYLIGSTASGVIIFQWNNHDVEAVSEDECKELLAQTNIRMYSDDGYILTDTSLRVGLFQGIAPIGAICYERLSEDSVPLTSDEDTVAELITISKMLSVYEAKKASSFSARDELMYARSAMEENKTACYAVDTETHRIIYCNAYAEKILPGIKLGKECPQPMNDIIGRIKSGEEKHCDAKGVFHYDTYEKHMQKWLSTAVMCTRRFGGDYVFLVTTTDISELMDNAKTKDKLTGLLTYEGFEIEAEKIIYGDSADYCIALFKVSNFRTLNDEFGYEIGDEILKATSDRIMLILGENERAGRSSGSGFVALLKKTDPRIMTAKLDYLFKVVQDDITKKHPSLNFAFTCGIYPIEKDSYQLSTALDRANLVIKNATKGKFVLSNIVEIYDFEINKQLEERKRIEGDMVGALKNNEFEVVYQPKVSLKTGLIYGAEALIRWHRPDGTVIQPSTFVPIFEDNEFVLEMDRWVYRRVFSQMKAWSEMGLELPVVSVNVSRLHLREINFPEKFEKIVDNYGIPHKNIEVELTESTFVKSYERLIDIMNDIRERGFKISIDDFGTGYSTLNLISMLPADVLKLDGNFFMKNKLSEKNKKVIESIIMLAKNLGLTVISEGVETDEQVQFLKENDCDAVQGFYYYRPMSEKHFKQLIAKQQNVEIDV